MGCCGQAEEGDEEKKARKQNKKIENQIQKDKQVRRSGHSHVDLVYRNSFYSICNISMNWWMPKHNSQFMSVLYMGRWTYNVGYVYTCEDGNIYF